MSHLSSAAHLWLQRRSCEAAVPRTAAAVPAVRAVEGLLRLRGWGLVVLLGRQVPLAGPYRVAQVQLVLLFLLPRLLLTQVHSLRQVL